MNLLTGAVHL